MSGDQRWTRAVRVAALVAGGWAVCRIVGPAVQVVRRGRDLRARARRYVQRPRPSTMRVLVVGDSAGVGVGASRPSCSVAGRLGDAHPAWSIGNLAWSGSRTADAAGVLQRLERRIARRRPGHRPVYDALIVHTGGNDALRATPDRALAASLRVVVGVASRLATRTVIVTGGNLALAPAWPWPWSWWFGRQSRRVRAVFRRGIPGRRVRFVDLFREPEDDPTTSDPERYFAPDGLHPSDDSYAIWFRGIAEELERS